MRMRDVFMAAIMTQVIVEPVELNKSPRLVRCAELIREEEDVSVEFGGNAISEGREQFQVFLLWLGRRGRMIARGPEWVECILFLILKIEIQYTEVGVLKEKKLLKGYMKDNKERESMNNLWGMVFERVEIQSIDGRTHFGQETRIMQNHYKKRSSFDDILSVVVRVISGLFHVLCNEKRSKKQKPWHRSDLELVVSCDLNEKHLLGSNCVNPGAGLEMNFSLTLRLAPLRDGKS